MQDSVNAHALIPGADFYAGYADGRYKNVADIRARFPHTRVISITVLGTTLDVDAADIETGDLTPASGARWARAKHNRGDHPTLYCNTSTRPAVEAECHKLGLELHRDYEIWEAHYDNVAALPAGAVAKQYRDHGPHGENVDMSVVADYWPGVDSKPAPLPAWFHRALDVKHPFLSGPDVHRVQRWLINHGFLPAHDAHGRANDDSIYGPATGAAVKTAKAHHGLHPDTHVGSALARIIG
jgi:hypothetical protein